jgi:undecaprenyl diphosphate synthase
MRLFELYLRRETHRCVENGIRLNVIGRRDRLAPAVLAALESAECATERCSEMHLRIAVDYSSRDMMLRAAEQCSRAGDWSRQGFAEALGYCEHGGAAAPDVDLLLRTGGEQRLSDFLLWECAYAEFLFLPIMWPDFDALALQNALAWFARRDRRFGAVVQQSQLLPNLHTAV